MKKLLLLAGALATFSSLARAQSVSNSSTPASGQTLVTMTLPKFVEIANVPATLPFTVDPTEYQLDYAERPIQFQLRTNSTAGAEVRVVGSNNGNVADTSRTGIYNGDISFPSKGSQRALFVMSGTGGIGGTTPIPVWRSSAAQPNFPAQGDYTFGVGLQMRVSNLNRFHVTAPGATGTQTYTNTLTFTVLPR